MFLKIDFERGGVKAVIDLFGRRFVFIANPKPDIPTSGIGSLVKDGSGPLKHVIFADYDNISESLVREELARLSRFYDLPPWYLFFTRRMEDEEGSEYGRFHGSYAALNLSKLTFSSVVDVLRRMHVDQNYKAMPQFSRYKMWVLRFLGKGGRPAPEFLDLVGDVDNLGREVSRAHLDFLETWYENIPNVPYENLDDSGEVFMTPYVTGKE